MVWSLALGVLTFVAAVLGQWGLAAVALTAALALAAVTSAFDEGAV